MRSLRKPEWRNRYTRATQNRVTGSEQPPDISENALFSRAFRYFRDSLEFLDFRDRLGFWHAIDTRAIAFVALLGACSPAPPAPGPEAGYSESCVGASALLPRYDGTHARMDFQRCQTTEAGVARPPRIVLPDGCEEEAELVGGKAIVLCTGVHALLLEDRGDAVVLEFVEQGISEPIEIRFLDSGRAEIGDGAQP